VENKVVMRSTASASNPHRWDYYDPRAPLTDTADTLTWVLPDHLGSTSTIATPRQARGASRRGRVAE